MNLLIKSVNTQLILRCENVIGSDLLKSDFVKKYIPDVDIQKIENNIDSGFVLNVTNTNTLLFTFENTQATLNGLYKSDYSLEDLITIIDYYLEYRRQLENIYSVSGSAVSKDNKGVLILGSTSGLGKTTLALNMCYSQKFKFIGDEKILLKSDSIIGGIKSIQFNKTWLNDSVPKDFDNKLIMESENVKINLIIQPSISKVGSGLEIEKWDSLKTNFHLYEELTRKIRGISRRISNYTYPLPSIDNEAIAMARSEFSRLISESVEAYSIKGNIEEVMQKINSLIS